jgi:hypothetical protein
MNFNILESKRIKNFFYYYYLLNILLEELKKSKTKSYNKKFFYLFNKYEWGYMINIIYIY